jgi:DNA-binding response OmpR family regulator
MRPKILIVDDDEATRLGIATLLEHAGYDPLTAGTLPAAMKLLTDEHPDLLLVDIRLDAYNGLHLVATRPNPIPAIVLTGFADPGIEADARRLGAEFLLKPVTPSVLLGVVNRLLFESRAGTVVPRRWPRKLISRDVVVDVDRAATARMLDVSYGGVRVELRRPSGDAPPGAFQLIVPPADVRVPVNVVWTRRRDATTWWCGGTIDEDTTPSWRSVVDSLA